MKDNVYFAKLSEIKYKNEKRLKALNDAYVKSKAKFKIGDTITDGRHTIIVRSVSALTHDRFIPEAYYRGVYLTSRGKINAGSYQCGVYAHEAKLVRKCS